MSGPPTDTSANSHSQVGSSAEATVTPTQVRFENPPDGVDDVLYEALAYEDPDAQFSSRVQHGQWDGIHRLYDPVDHVAPAGLLGRIEDVLETNGYDLQVNDTRTFAGESISTSWAFEGTLRPYQADGLKTALAENGGVVSLPTGAGKTLVALRAINALGRRAIVFVHTKGLLHQWADRIQSVLGINPGRIGDDQWSEGPVTVAIMDSLVSRGTDALDAYDVAVYDECHRTSAAETFHEIGQSVPAPFRIGLSATPWRRVDGETLKIEAAIGNVVYEKSAEALIDAGYLATPDWHIVDPKEYGPQPTPDPNEPYSSAYARCIADASVRHTAIADKATDLAAAGRRVLISVDQINHGTRLQDELGDHHGSVWFLTGNDSTDRRQAVLDAFDSGDILISTLVREGIDLPKLDAVVLASGGKSSVKIIQRIGRALRPAGTDPAVVVDIRDRGRYLGSHYNARQETMRSYYGDYGPTPDGSVAKTRSWLEDNHIPTDQLRITQESDGRVRVEITGWIDNFARYRDLMDSVDADYDGTANYITTPQALGP